MSKLKKCPRCEQRLGISRFYGKLATYCKECQKARRKEEYAAFTPEQHQRRKEQRSTPEYRNGRKLYNAQYMAALSEQARYELRRKARLKHRYGVTPEQYDAKLAEQGGGCAICKRISGKIKFSFDHNHACCKGRNSCGKCLRGLICQPCNAWIGFIESHPGWLERVQIYLARYKETQNGNR